MKLIYKKLLKYLKTKWHVQKMREIILHIGMNKTGTSAIQNSLYGINSHGIRTVRFKEKNHSVPMKTIFSERPARTWKNIGLTDNQIKEKRDEYKKILEEELADKSIKRFIVSGEAISDLTEIEQQNLCLFLKKKKINIRIVYVVRDPFSWAVSVNQQRAKWGAKDLSSVNPHYKKRLVGFMKECGKENISIYKYEDLIQKGLIKSFSEIVGFKLEEGKRVNESVTSETLFLLYALNNIKIATVGSHKHLRARVEIMRALQSFFSESNGFKKINLGEFNLVAKSAAKDLDWLEENFGITYPSPWKSRSDIKDFEDCPRFEKLVEFFQHYNLTYKSSLSVTENIQNLYTRFLSFAEIDGQIDALVKKENWYDALQLIIKSIELGDERHSLYRQASNFSHRLKKLDEAIEFAKKAVIAKDNNLQTQKNHEKHLANMLRISGK